VRGKKEKKHPHASIFSCFPGKEGRGKGAPKEKTCVRVTTLGEGTKPREGGGKITPKSPSYLIAVEEKERGKGWERYSLDSTGGKERMRRGRGSFLLDAGESGRWTESPDHGRRKKPGKKAVFFPQTLVRNRDGVILNASLRWRRRDVKQKRGEEEEDAHLFARTGQGEKGTRTLFSTALEREGGGKKRRKKGGLLRAFHAASRPGKGKGGERNCIIKTGRKSERKKKKKEEGSPFLLKRGIAEKRGGFLACLK